MTTSLCCGATWSPWNNFAIFYLHQVWPSIHHKVYLSLISSTLVCDIVLLSLAKENVCNCKIKRRCEVQHSSSFCIYPSNPKPPCIFSTPSPDVPMCPFKSAPTITRSSTDNPSITLSTSTQKSYSSFTSSGNPVCGVYALTILMGQSPYTSLRTISRFPSLFTSVTYCFIFSHTMMPTPFLPSVVAAL